jgi:hypothetical protein
MMEAAKIAMTAAAIESEIKRAFTGSSFEKFKTNWQFDGRSRRDAPYPASLRVLVAGFPKS